MDIQKILALLGKPGILNLIMKILGGAATNNTNTNTNTKKK